MATSLEVTCGNESLAHARISVSASYMYHINCPIQYRRMEVTTLAAVAKTKHVNTVAGKEFTISRIDSKTLPFLNPNNNHERIKATIPQWYQSTYAIPNNVVIKLDVTEHITGLSGKLNRGILFLRMRDSAAWTNIKFRSGYGLETIADGRFDILTMEKIQALKIVCRFNELSYISESQIAKFLDISIVQPASISLDEKQEEVVIEGETFKINKPRTIKSVEVV